ncbi:MAG: SDR family oxidoreductase [bacterium]|nr:SDR family oxidoreductase [bacterium]
MANHLEGRVIVITGAGGGFGRLVAQKTAARGAKIVASDVDRSGLDETVASVEAAGGEAIGVVADVTDRAAMAALAAAALDRFGAIDVMLNNAGVMPLAFFTDHAEAAAAWDRCIDINLKGVLNGICAVHDAMTRQGRGHVVNVSSIYGNGPVPGAAVYGATKAAVRFLSEALRQESQGRIKVTTIRPTGVPGTNLGAGMINPAAFSGILGAGAEAFMAKMGQVFGEDPPTDLTDPEAIEYFALAPELLADQIVYAIDQPWGVSISDVTVRASGDGYML